MEKSPDAFRTISEVAEWLDIPTHVLRFWESRFSQVKPVKRAGGRRYYRPADMRLIGGIKKLLHEDGMTIRGVQKLLREEGVKHVSGFSQPLDHEQDQPVVLDGTVAAAEDEEDMALSFLPSAGPEESAPSAVLRAENPVLPEEEVAAHVPGGEDEDAVAASEPEGGDAASEIPEAERDAEPVLAADETEGDAPEADGDVAGDAPDESDEDGAGAPPPETTVPPAPSETQLVAFGSVRGRTEEREVELPLGLPPETRPSSSSGMPDLFDEDNLDTSRAEEPLEQPEPERAPLVADAPDIDPDDDAEEHAAPPGAMARLLQIERETLRSEPIRIEQAVAALRAVRDRSMS